MRDIMLIIHFIGLAMGLGTSFAHLFLSMATDNLPAEEARRFRMHSLALSRMGHIGLALLILSGGYLMTPYWESLAQMPYMMVKLALVLILTLLIVRIGKLSRLAKKGDADVYLAKMKQSGQATLIVALLIVVMAVMTFH